MGLSACIQTTRDGMVLLEIEVQPGSSRQGIVGFNQWRGRLQVAVKAEAQQGKANIAVCNVISALLKAEVKVISGHTSRQKKVSIEGLKTPEIIQRLEELI